MRAKTQKQKELAGTLADSRATSYEGAYKPLPRPVDLPDDFPEPPIKLDEYATTAYYRLAAHLHGANALHAADSIILAHAAYWMSLWVRTIEENGEDFIQETPNGYKQVSAVFTIIDKAEAHISKYFRALGIGPRARQDIRAFVNGRGGEAEDILDQLLNRHRRGEDQE